MGRLLGIGAVGMALAAYAVLPAVASANTGEITKADASPSLAELNVEASFTIDTCPGTTCYYRVTLEAGTGIGCNINLNQNTVLWDPYADLNDGKGFKYVNPVTGAPPTNFWMPQGGAEYVVLCLTRRYDGLSATFTLDFRKIEPPPPPPLITRWAASRLAEGAVHKEFGRRYARGTKRKMRCTFAVPERYVCNVSWNYKKKHYSGHVIVPAAPDSNEKPIVNVTAVRR